DKTFGLLIVTTGSLHGVLLSLPFAFVQFLAESDWTHFDEKGYPTFVIAQSMKKPLNRKRRRRSIIAFEMIRLDRNSREPLHQQLYRQIRDELAEGAFNRNSSRLPSTRALSADLGIARLTVKLAFEKLHAEGYLQARRGSGTFVAEPLPETFLSPLRPKAEPRIERPPRFSDRVRNIPD